MGDTADRRRFFLEVVRGAAEIVREVSEAIRSELEPELAQEEPWYTAPAVPARPATRTLGEADLLALAEEVGLAARREAVRALARPSLRLTLAEGAAQPGERSRLGGPPELPAELEWPTWQGRELSFLGQVDLAQAHRYLAASPLPRQGLLLFFYETETRPSGLRPEHRGSCRVLHLEGPGLRRAQERAALPESPLHLSCELMLPRSWSAWVDSLDLEAEELAAWEELRERLARAQGVELEELSPQWQSLHRLLGYPDELGSGLELDCQLASAGVDVEADEAASDPRRPELEAAAGDWQLLLQISDDERLGVSWGEGFGRLWFLIRRQDLEARAFDQAWAIRR
jgi:hypothetical protein